MSYYNKYKKEINEKGYIGTNSYIDYNNITEEQKIILKHLIDINFLEDAKNMIESVLLDLYTNIKKVK